MTYKIRLIDNSEKKYLFLDLDGVMNSFNDYGMSHERFKKNLPNLIFELGKKQIKILNKIIDLYNPRIVLSSYWRTRCTIDEVNDIFKSHNINSKVVGFTDDKGKEHKDRWSQIKRYIDKHKIENYIILDDNEMPGANNLIKTDSYEGLTKKQLKKIKKIW